MAFKVLCSKNDYKNGIWRTGRNPEILGHLTGGTLKLDHENEMKLLITRKI